MLSQEAEADKARDGSITAVALYDYQAMAEDEISFDPNDIITNIEMVGSLPSQGGLHNIMGFVSFLTLNSMFLIVICPKCPNVIYVHLVQVDEGWWIGESHGKFGLFPANYVEVIKK